MKRCQCSTYCPPPGGSAPRGGIIPPDFSAPQGGIIPPDFSAPDCTDPLEYYSTHPKVDQVRCAVEIIKLRHSHADLCGVRIVYCVSIYCIYFIFQLYYPGKGGMLLHGCTNHLKHFLTC